MTDFTIETAPAPKLTALLGTTRFDLASLDLSAIKTTVSGRTVTVGPVTAKLTKAAADGLNQAFAHDRVHRGPDHRHRHGGRNGRVDTPPTAAPGRAQSAGAGG